MDPTQAALGVPSFTLEQLRSLVTELESGSTELARALEPVHGPWVSLTAAVVLIGKGQRPRALAAVRRALEQGATSWFVHLVSARLSQSVGAVQGLSPRFERALELASELPHRLRVLDAWCDAAESLGQIREAVHAVEQSLVLAGSDVGRHLTAARLLRLGGSHARVMPHMRAVLWLQPSAEHYLVTAETLRKLGRAEEARGVAHESTPELTDLSADSVADAARDALLRMWVDPPSAVEAGFEELLRARDGHPEVLVRRGTFRLLQGRHREATGDFDDALRADPAFGHAAVGLGAVALGEGDPERCIRWLRRGGLGEANDEARALSGEALRRLGRTPQATRILTECTQAEPARASGWINLALCLADGGDPQALSLGVARVRRAAPGLLADAAEVLGLDLDAAPEPPGEETSRALLERCLTQMRGSREVATGMYCTREGRWRSLVWRPDAPDDALQRDALKRARELLAWGARGGREGPVSIRP